MPKRIPKRFITIKQATDNIGRPEKYSEADFDEIFERIANGESVNQILKNHQMCWDTFCRRIKHKPLSEKYAHACIARATRAHHDMEEFIRKPIEYALDPKAANAEIQHRRLIADYMKWANSKMYPKLFGDKIKVSTDDDSKGLEVKINGLDIGKIG